MAFAWTDNFSFYTKSKDEKIIVKNNKVMVMVEFMHFSSSMDRNPVLVSIAYFGVIEEIWQIMYTLFTIHFLKCK